MIPKTILLEDHFTLVHGNRIIIWLNIDYGNLEIFIVKI